MDIKEHRCAICRNEQGNKLYKIKERMLNRGDEFTYLLCKKCGTLQLVDKINDMGQYYERYSIFEQQGKDTKYHWLKRCYINMLLSKMGKYVLFDPFCCNELSFLNCLIGLGIGKTQKILDVGCGNGIWLKQLEDIGFSNLSGIDKFVPEKLLKNRCKFYKGEIYELNDEKFDLISLHHSFEHMQNPEAVLEKIKSLLHDSGVCIIRIPVMGKVAWKKYKTDWYQIDAPRHAFLYTEKALEYLCEKTGLEIYNRKYDSQYGQFYVSEQYAGSKKNFEQICKMTKKPKDIKKYKRWARIANMREEGDQAIFFIRKSDKC